MVLCKFSVHHIQEVGLFGCLCFILLFFVHFGGFRLDAEDTFVNGLRFDLSIVIFFRSRKLSRKVHHGKN